MAAAAKVDPEVVVDNDELHPDEAEVLGLGNGRSIEDRAKDGEAEDPENDGTPQLVLEGIGSALSSSVGGMKPRESVFKMSGVQLPISGGREIKKDTEIWVAVPVAIDDVRIYNRRKNREIVGVVREHKAIPIGQPIILDGPPADV